MSSRFWQWNEFGNRSIFDRVTAYKNAHFLGTTLFKKNARASHSVTANKGDYHANNAARNTQTESFVDGVRNMRVVKDDVETERDGSQRYSSTDQICNRKKTPTVTVENGELPHGRVSLADPKIWKGGGGRRETVYQPRRTLSQIHIMNYTRFTREKPLADKKIGTGGGSRSPSTLPL